MSFLFRRFQVQSLMLIVCAALAGCDDAATREQKAISVQLKKALRRQDYEQALPLARKLVDLAPQNNGAWESLVHAQFGISDFGAAKETLTTWRATVKEPSPELEESEGDLANKEQDLPHALHFWQRSLAKSPKNVAVLEKIADLQHSQKHWPEEEAALSAIIEINDSGPIRAARAICRRHLHHWEDALKDVRKAHAMARGDFEVQQCTKIFERLTKFLDQIKEFDARCAAAPTDGGLVADRALLFLRSGDPELALEDAEAAEKLAPWAMRPRLFHALALIGLNRATECDALSIRKTLRLESLTPHFLETMSRLDSAISVEPQNSEFYVSRAWQLNEIDQPAAALEDAETAMRFDMKSASACAEASYALMKLGREADAFEKIKRATELDPNFAAGWQYRGELEMQRGDYFSAADSLSRAIAVNQTPLALRRREECYRRLGLLAKAEQDRKALEEISGQK